MTPILAVADLRHLLLAEQMVLTGEVNCVELRLGMRTPAEYRRALEIASD